MSVFKKINQFVEKLNLIKPNQTIIIGLSGGPDSIFLLHYFLQIKKEYNLTVIAAHLDHEWRENSIQDKNFCEKFCKKNNVAFVAARASELHISQKKTGSKEELGRILRRIFFQKIKQEYHADSIALAHHLDDQLETFFIRLLRGTSITGLACMRPHQDDYIRPLLCLQKQEILAYLEQHKIPFVIDPSNMSPEFLRNRIRLSLIPVLEQTDKRYYTNIQKTIINLQETDKFLQKLAQQKLAEITDEKQTLNIKKFLALDIFLQKLVLTQWLYAAQISFTLTHKFIDEILRFFANTKSTTHTFNQWSIIKKRGQATIIKTHAI